MSLIPSLPGLAGERRRSAMSAASVAVGILAAIALPRSRSPDEPGVVVLHERSNARLSEPELARQAT